MNDWRLFDSSELIVEAAVGMPLQHKIFQDFEGLQRTEPGFYSRPHVKVWGKILTVEDGKNGRQSWAKSQTSFVDPFV